MARRRLVYRGGTKSLFEGDAADTLVLHFRDEPTNGQESRSDNIEGKGILNNRISEHIMHRLNKIGVSTHLVQRLNMREQVVRVAEVLPIQILIRNFAGSDIRQRLGLKGSELLPRPLIEFYLKDDALGFPLITEDHLNAFGWATSMDLDEIYPLAGRANDFLSGMMAGAGFTLAAFSIEVGRIWEDDRSRLVIVDELSPDVFHLWDDRSDDRYLNGNSADSADNQKKVHTELALRLGILPEVGARNMKPRLVN